MVEAKKLSVQEQLIQYRNRKRKEEEYVALKQKIWRYFSVVLTFWRKTDEGVTVNTKEAEEEEEEEEASTHAAVNNVSIQ